MARRTGGQEDPKEAADLRTHQAGPSAQAPHPVKTDRWDGSTCFTEAICLAFRNSCAGEFRLSLNITDIQNVLDGDAGACWGRGKPLWQQAWMRSKGCCPFRLLGLDSDNGIVIPHCQLQAWCERNRSNSPRTSVQEGRQRSYRSTELDSGTKLLVPGNPMTLKTQSMFHERLYPPRAARLWLESVSVPREAGEIAWDRRCGRVYDVPKTPWNAGGKPNREMRRNDPFLKDWQRSRDPFVSKSHRTETRTDLRLANRRLSPKHEEKIETAMPTGTQRPAKRAVEKTSLSILESLRDSHFPHHNSNKQFSGYIINGATWIARVPFLKCA